MRVLNFLYIFILLCLNIATIFFVKKLMFRIPTENYIANFYKIVFYKELYLLVVSGSLAFFIYMYLNKVVELSRLFPVLTGLLLISTSLIGFFVFHEDITMKKIIGIILVISGIILISR